jgi:hypothetical protein
MDTFSLRALLLVVALFSAISARAATPETDFNGHYELAGAKTGHAFSLDVKQNHSRAEVSFFATMEDGSGTSPDGAGKGRVEDGVLSFNFKDSFNNEGTCTLSRGKGGYSLSITVLKVVDPSPFHFYGDILLKKTAGQPQLSSSSDR